MLLEIFQSVGVVHDLEVESPVVIHAGLPDVAGFVVFLGSEGRMVEVLGEEAKLFAEGLTYGGRGILQRVEHAVGKVDPHRTVGLRFLARARRRRLASSDAIASAAVLKGPSDLPAAYSFSLWAMPRSMAFRCAGVYSSSDFGPFGRMVITLPETLKSSLSPLLRPARRRTEGGTMIGVLLFTMTFIVLM